MKGLLAFFEGGPGGFKADESQRLALQTLEDFVMSDQERGVQVISGPAGSGKTFMMKALVQWMQALERPVVLLAPTGRAAKVLARTTRMRANTLHRQLYRPVEEALMPGRGLRVRFELKSMELGVDLNGDRELIGRVVDRVKEMEARGFTFEAADASFELLVHEEMSGKRPSFFTINHWVTSVERAADQTITTKAEVTVTAKGQEITCSGEGNGPVNAFDNALRTGLISLYPELSTLELTDYKVRILEGRLGTGAVTRVLVETSDGKGEWNTVGVHENVIAASAMALEDAVTFGLMRQGRKPE